MVVHDYVTYMCHLQVYGSSYLFYFDIVCAVMGLCMSTLLNNVLKSDAFSAKSHEIHSTGGRNIPALPVNPYHKQRQRG
jgi:hypothetical protein